ncbi:MAG: YigZ family protein [Ruminococcus sp.]|nr:YigZ family protein [Ruminococcus sp.]
MAIIMSDSYKTVKEFSSGEFVEKRSRFIGWAKPVKTEAEALDFINKIKKEHWDARHNCYAYTLREGSVKRYSDDGEPQGTAGVPMLDVLTKNEIEDVVVVVTRYFGGVLLGTGGLVRAYSKAAKIALDAAKVITMSVCSECTLSCNYNQYGKLNTLILNDGAVIDGTDFSDNVTLKFHIPSDRLNSLEKNIADATAGTVKVEIVDEKYFEIDEI